jgi:hypothetical protein
MLACKTLLQRKKTMAFKDRFPKPTLIFLGIACEITNWKTIFVDFQSNKVYFTAICELTVGGYPVFLQNCQFSEELVWQLDPYDPYTAITASEFSLSRHDPTTMQLKSCLLCLVKTARVGFEPTRIQITLPLRPLLGHVIEQGYCS